MKTLTNFQKLMGTLPMLLCLCMLTACPEPPEPLPPTAKFVGDYKMNETEGKWTFITPEGSEPDPFSFESSSVINISAKEGTSDIIELDLEEFSEELLKAGFTQIESIKFEDDPTAKITGNKFEIDNFDLTLTFLYEGEPLSITFEFSGDGKVEGNELDLDFKMVYLVQGASLEIGGNSQGEK